MSTPSRTMSFGPVAVLGLLLVLLAFAGVAAAETPQTSISTGREGGSYDGIGRRLQAMLLEEQDYAIAVESSSGSIQNLARLADPTSPVGLALTQSDALAQFLKMNAEFANEYIVLGDAGKECVLLIAARNGDLRSFAHLEDAAGAEISVDDPGSGAAVTFGYLLGMDPDLADLKLVFTDLMETMLQLKVGGAHTALGAAMVVQRPSTRSEVVEVLLANPKEYRLVPIRESDVASGSLPDESVVYTFERVRVGGEGAKDAVEVDTVCTRSLLLASKRKLDRSIRSRLSVLMLKSAAQVIGEGD